jgi:hypothetical protein
MRRRAFNEIHTHRAGRIVGQLLQLQAVVRDLQSKVGLIVRQRQAQAPCPVRRLFLRTDSHGLDPDAVA